MFNRIKQLFQVKKGLKTVDELNQVKKEEKVFSEIIEDKTSLSVISLTKDEIEILNVLFGGSTDVIKIRQIIWIEGKYYLIEQNTKFDFDYIWCDDNLYEDWPYFISRAEFNDNNTTALLPFGIDGGPLRKRGWLAKFIKRDNKWELISHEAEYMS